MRFSVRLDRYLGFFTNSMKKFFVITLLFTVLGGFAHSQSGWNWNAQNQYGGATANEGYYEAASQIPVYNLDPSICFEPGWDFGAYFSAMFPSDGDGTNGYGGGFLLNYFFDRNIGIEMNYAAHGQGESLHVFHTNAVYRLPINSCFCGAIAPYAFGGVGFQSNGNFDLLYDIGVGVDVRFQSWGCTALFADYTYNFVEKSLDFQQVRLGFKLPF